MKNWKNRMFLEAPADGGGGSAVMDTLGPVETGGGTANPGTEVQTPTASEPAAPAAGGFDARALGQEFGAALRDHFPAPQQGQQQQAPLTPEEAKKLLNFFEVDDGFLKEFGNLDTQKSALEKLRDGITKHIVTIMQARNSELVQQINSKYDPFVSNFERVEGERRQERFNTGFPQLAAPQLQPILHAVAQSFRAEGKTFNDEKSMFDAIAKGVEAVIQQSNPAFKLTAAQAAAAGATKPNNAPASAIPVTTPGTGGGGGQGPAAASTGPKALSFLPKVR